MSKDLPLWEDDGSDVKIEHRLQSGHALVLTDDMERVLKRIRSVFGLSKPIKISDEAKPEWLPQEQKRGITVTLLNDERHWHFILANFQSRIAIFAPHCLFFDSAKWMKLSRKLKVQLAFVLQGNIDSYYYYVFVKGKHICSVDRDVSGIHQREMEPMEFYLNGKLIHRTDDEKYQFTEDTAQLISEDVIVEVDAQRRVRFKTPLSEGEFREPSSVRHAVFKAKQLPRS